MPLEHIRMHCRAARSQTQIRNRKAIAAHIAGTIPDAKHIADLPYRRADIRLAELEQNIFLDSYKCRTDIKQQPIDCRRHGFDIPVCIIIPFGRIDAVKTEIVDEIEFEAIYIPCLECLHICFNNKLANFRETRVEYSRVKSVQIFNKILAFESLVVLAFKTDEGHGIPNHILHSHGMNLLDMGGHIWETPR